MVHTLCGQEAVIYVNNVEEKDNIATPFSEA